MYPEKAVPIIAVPAVDDNAKAGGASLIVRLNVAVAVFDELVAVIV